MKQYNILSIWPKCHTKHVDTGCYPLDNKGHHQTKISIHLLLGNQKTSTASWVPLWQFSVTTTAPYKVHVTQNIKTTSYVVLSPWHSKLVNLCISRENIQRQSKTDSRREEGKNSQGWIITEMQSEQSSVYSFLGTVVASILPRSLTVSDNTNISVGFSGRIIFTVTINVKRGRCWRAQLLLKTSGYISVDICLFLAVCLCSWSVAVCWLHIIITK